MKFSVATTTKLDEGLKRHLLRTDGQEDLCFALWHPSQGSNRQSALISDIVLPTTGRSVRKRRQPLACTRVSLKLSTVDPPMNALFARLSRCKFLVPRKFEINAKQRNARSQCSNGFPQNGSYCATILLPSYVDHATPTRVMSNYRRLPGAGRVNGITRQYQWDYHA